MISTLARLSLNSSSKVSDSRVDVSCHDTLTNRSFSAPSPVAVRTEHLLDRAPSAMYGTQTTWEPS